MSKILIADDEQEALDVLSDFLTDVGHDITVVDDGEKAVEKIKTAQYDIVILDLKMPRISGEGVLEVIASDSPGTKVIITTGYSDGGQTEARVQTPNVYAFIEKPIDLIKLDECIQKISAPAGD